MATKNTTTATQMLEVDRQHDALERADEAFRAAAARGDDAAIEAAQKDREAATLATERAEAKALAIAGEMPKAKQTDAEQTVAATVRRLALLAKEGDAAAESLREAIGAATAAVDAIAAAVEATVMARILCASSCAGLTRTPQGGTTVTPGLAESLRKLAGRIDYTQSRIMSAGMNVSEIERKAKPRPVHPGYIGAPTRPAA